MIRAFPSVCRSLALAVTFVFAGVPAASLAQNAASAKAKAAAAKKVPAKAPASGSAAAKGAPADSAAGKPLLIASYGDWGAYAAKSGSVKTCYALAQPKERLPNNLKRDPAYIFIADRPAENVHDEVSIIMGFDVKGGGDDKVAGGAGTAATASAQIGSDKFDLVAKGSNLWLQNIARQGPMIAAMRKNAKLTIQAMSLKGNLTTDDYSLSGLAQALDRMHKECQ